MTVTAQPAQAPRGDDANGDGAAGVRSQTPDDRPVEFWPTSAIRAALDTDDLAVWQRIAAAIKRDPFGRTARQVEEVLETARPYGVSSGRGRRSSPPGSGCPARSSPAGWTPPARRRRR